MKTAITNQVENQTAAVATAAPVNRARKVLIALALLALLTVIVLALLPPLIVGGLPHLALQILGSAYVI
jgi:hypothetical protein